VHVNKERKRGERGRGGAAQEARDTTTLIQRPAKGGGGRRRAEPIDLEAARSG
jgi:hypothetical protein